MADASPPTGLRTAYAVDPVGIDEREPTLRWRAPTDRRGASQTAFRVLVATSPDRLSPDAADVWDTGKRRSERPAVRYDGPELDAGEAYHWTVRVWDDRGEASAWSEPASWETGLLDADDWTASWIRRPTEEAERGEFSYVRREFELDGAVERARAYVSASHQYALSVNGEPVDHGQSFSYPDFQYYKTVALDDALSEGDNAVGALYNWNGEGQGRPEAEPGFIAQLVVEFADGRKRVITTDGEWQTRPAEWVSSPLRNGEIAEPVETIDGRVAPRGWDEPGFDDAAWEPAEVVGAHPTDPWERLIAQDRQRVRHRVDPESVERVDEDTYVVDFGTVYPGVPNVRFEDGEDGHRVNLLAGYRLTDDGYVDDTEGTQWTDMRYEYLQREGAQTFRPFNYLGIRYLQIDDPGEDLDADQISLVATHNEVPDANAGTFECGDETVEAVFELARHSALYGSQEQFVDTPTREKGQFLADAFNVSAVTTRAFRERRLSRQAIREFLRSHYRYWAPEGRFNAVYPNGDGKRDIPDFTVTFPQWLYEYFRESDDRATLERAYPVVRAVADYVVEHVDEETGLVTRLSGGEGGPYHEGIVDWPPEMRYGYDRDWPARTTVNVLCANALARAADVAAELDRPDAERAYFEENREAIETGIDEHLRHGDRYVDGADPKPGDGSSPEDDANDALPASDHSAQHANALPLATGLVPDERVDDVAERVAADGLSMGPMMVRWLLDALDRTDRPAAMVDLLTDAEADGWANILDVGGTFTWETWHCRTLEPADERHNRSESHAMGATVLTSIQRTLLGVRVTSPGAATLEIAPPAEGLDEASGRVPTERGPVAVEWERDDDAFALDVTVPWNATATVVLPGDERPLSANEGGDALLGVDGPVADPPEGVESIAVEDGDLVVEVGAGSYSFERQ
ncbi:family 78 glycoside hydrolase catalytic domain [Halosimplex sp. J119]